MTKFSFEEKVQAALDYLGGRETYRQIANRVGINEWMVRKWVKLYRYQGVEGLAPQYTNYTAQFKMNILNYITENRTSVFETAALFKIPSPSTILAWQKKFELEGYDGLLQKKRGRPPMTESKAPSSKKQLDPNAIEVIMAENERLRMENAYLKKLNALVQKERKLKSDKKL